MRTAAPLPRETLLGLVSDLVRRSWQEVDASHYLDDYQASQWLAPSSLRALQLAKLRRLVWHCFLHVPYYSRLLAGSVTPSEIEQLESPAQLPVVLVEARRARTEFAASHSERTDREVKERRRALRLRAESWAGAPPSRVVAVWGREAMTAPRPLAEAEIAALRLALARAGRAVLTGPGPSLGELSLALEHTPARRFFQRSQPIRVTGVIARDGDVTGGAAQLAERLGARLYKWWTVRELGLIAAPCELGGLHLMADQLLIDVVDGDGHALPAGVIGRLLITDLHEYTAPWLRHDLGHRGRLLADPCLCGRSLPLVELA